MLDRRKNFPTSNLQCMRHCFKMAALFSKLTCMLTAKIVFQYYLTLSLVSIETTNSKKVPMRENGPQI